MPTYTIMVWNVETMGRYNPAIAIPQRAAVSMFIAELIKANGPLASPRTNGVDVLVIQELRVAGVSMLNTILEKLNPAPPAAPAYSSDFCPAGIPEGTDLEHRPTLKRSGTDQVSSLIDKTTNQEAYGVIARVNLIKPEKTLLPISRACEINLCFAGVKGELSIANPSIPFIRDPNNTPVAICPFPCSNTATPAQVTGITAERFRNARNADKRNRELEDPVDALLQEYTVRRPCKVVINCNGTQVHLIAYHAPVGGAGPAFGACCTGNLREVQDAARFPNVIVAGDFNFMNSDNINASFDELINKCNFTRGTFILTSSSYAPTVVHSDGSIKVPRDLLFYKFGSTIKNISTEADNVLNVPLLLDTAGGAPNAFASAILSSTDFRNMVTVVKSPASPALQALFSQALPPLSGFTQASAAELYYLYVSDHLPVLVNFDA